MGFPRWRRRTVLFTALLAAWIALPRLVNVYGDFLWFRSLDLSSVYITILSAKVALFALGSLLGFAVLYGGYLWSARNVREEKEYRGSTGLVAGLALLSLLFGAVASAQWETVLVYLNAVQFGVADPVFTRDVAFYVFSLPFYWSALGFAALLAVSSISVSLLVYGLHFGIRNTEESLEEFMRGVAVQRTSFDFVQFMKRMEEHARAHAMAWTAALLLLVAAAAFLARYGLLFSEQGAVYGAGFTDLAVSLPLLTSLAAISGVAALVALGNVKLRRSRYVGGAVAAVILVAVLGSVAGWAVQSYVVEPDEFNKERPHITNEINFTRDAYALERVSERQFPVSAELTREQIEANPGTIDNVRLWDWRPLLKTYNELQIFRTYYTFTDVDIDRYSINGTERQVMLSSREVDVDALPPRSQSWVNRHLVYTHGFGITMSPVREVSQEGLPELYVKDIPPKSPVGIEIDQPRIYYGENTDDYAVVNTGTRELDYPAGDRNVYTSYDGSGGVPVGSALRRAVYSLMFGSPQIFFSDSIREGSRIQFRRTVQERARTVAPFLEFDRDPYVVASEGKLYWIYDAYTTTGNYPYSRPVSFRGEEVNYMRNSVKVVVDAYTGDMQFYVAEPDDPLVRTYREVFPDLFRDMEEMPESLREHVRYPEDLFTVQSDLYRDYHMRDPNVFYNREDQWRVPNEILRGKEERMEPYYIIMKLPGEEEPEFMQIMPFIPRGKENMIGWLAARSDRPNYGTLQAYKFSKQELIFGPMQVESRIDQDPDISQQITLWSQSGSDVLRGNLLAIPIDDTIMYVEPLFLESREQGSLPQLKRVIVTHGDRLTMQPTLEDALAVLFGEKEDEGVAVADPETLAEIRTLFQEAQAALQRGDFATYGEKTAEIEELLDR